MGWEAMFAYRHILLGLHVFKENLKLLPLFKNQEISPNTLDLWLHLSNKMV